jgi:hypothetical protein
MKMNTQSFYNQVQQLRSKPSPVIDGETFEQWSAKKKVSDYASLPLVVMIEDSALGESEPIKCETLNQASKAFQAFIDENNLGSRDAGRCVIRKGFGRSPEQIVAHVSYNGRVWAGAPWEERGELLFDPRA